MDVIEAIRARRSVKRFTGRAVTREEVEALLDAAVWAPNHHLTEPWRFVVMGREARAAFVEVRGRLRAEKAPDAAAAELIRARSRDALDSLPLMVAVAQVLAGEPVTREEDYAATWMAVQNLALAAVAAGLGTHIRTGRIMDDPELRRALQLSADWRVVALVDVGEPAELPEPRPRMPSREWTNWLP
jgi:nitroreductase